MGNSKPTPLFSSFAHYKPPQLSSLSKMLDWNSLCLLGNRLSNALFIVFGTPNTVKKEFGRRNITKGVR